MAQFRLGHVAGIVIAGQDNFLANIAGIIHIQRSAAWVPWLVDAEEIQVEEEALVPVVLFEPVDRCLDRLRIVPFPLVCALRLLRRCGTTSFSGCRSFAGSQGTLPRCVGAPAIGLMAADPLAGVEADMVIHTGIQVLNIVGDHGVT